MQSDGAYTQVLDIFYEAVVLPVLLFSSDSWVILEAMTKIVEGTQVGFLRKIQGKRSQRTTHKAWATLVTGEVLQEFGIHTSATYIGCRQLKVEK